MFPFFGSFPVAEAVIFCYVTNKVGGTVGPQAVAGQIKGQQHWIQIGGVAGRMREALEIGT